MPPRKSITPSPRSTVEVLLPTSSRKSQPRGTSTSTSASGLGSGSGSSSISTPIRLLSPSQSTHLHHHKTADEQTLEAATKFFDNKTLMEHLTPHSISSTSGQGSGSIDGVIESPRDRRHRHLEEARRLAEESSQGGFSSLAGNILGGKKVNRQDEDDEEVEDQEEVPDSAALSTGTMLKNIVNADSSFDEDDDSDSAGSSSESSDEDSNSESGSDSDSSSSSVSENDEVSEDEEDEEKQLEKLLQKARLSAQSKTITKSSSTETGNNGIEDQEDILRLDSIQEEKKDLPIPDISIPDLPPSEIIYSETGAATLRDISGEAGPSKVPGDKKKALKSVIRRKKDEHGLELDDRPYEKTLSKKEKANQPRKATTSELWATIPTARSDILPQMRKDYQALALANSLDPKRFMKGSTKLSKVPESFAIGTLIDAPRKLQSTTISREYKYRPGQIVKDLVKDQEMEGYAKRKYEDLQWSKMENGRGKGWKKRSKW